MKRGELDDLLAYATIARTRSFTRAAAELGVSPSALSHMMRVLETRLGVRLLARTTRSVAPTPAGERLLRSVVSAVEEVELGLASMVEWRGDPSGVIRITAPQPAARIVLAPALPRFLLDNPKITVDICVESRFADLVRDGFDAGIRWGDNLEQDMVAIRVGPSTRLIVVGAPAYFERHPHPLSPDDLKRHNCVNYRSLSGNGTFPWTLQRDGAEVRHRTGGQLIVANDLEFAETLILSGAGLGMMLEETAAPHLAAGRLVRVLDEWCHPFVGWHLYYPSRHVTPALRALIEVLKWTPSQSGRAHPAPA
ncbi:LysR family transcriptional regulator [Bradyrhizobium sp. INPA01-394B]|uniref:LysR family transcriptional regulator n=1 Tax=Bradyrhizobium campsiandrae TaxID=1729892 RepID=A0ABR7U556_9BRAD|nr:LysR family transcriptional regulator [Bradyrhizobium campsiandrae]MBC9879869.1 LysR family transcriptional regulator [Bradyrhizobium campsiandrae]MBC9978554.1 LysR family transcriptional regulator [Bradyrhizobium campsiandrae]